METKHTKGEWKQQPCTEGIEIYSNDLAIARIPKNYANKQEAEANAKLIAAAPKLLEALIELKSQFCGEKTPERLAAYKAELAIKSATE